MCTMTLRALTTWEGGTAPIKATRVCDGRDSPPTTTASSPVIAASMQSTSVATQSIRRKNPGATIALVLLTNATTIAAYRHVVRMTS